VDEAIAQGIQRAVNARRVGVVDEMESQQGLNAAEGLGDKLWPQGRAANADGQHIGEMLLAGGIDVARVDLLGEGLNFGQGAEDILLQLCIGG
jgi:hypothetical protein